MNENVVPIAKLGKRVKEEGEALGLRLHAFGLAPDLDGDGPAHAHMLFIVDPEKLADEPDLSEMEASFQLPDPGANERLADEARERLTDLERTLRDPSKGILDD